MTDEDQEDPYQDMIVDNEDEPREKIKENLQSYLGFTSGGKNVYKEGYDDLSSPKKIIVELLGSKVKVSLDFEDKEGYPLSELVERLEYDKSTVKGRVYGGISDIVVSDDGQLHIPNYKVSKALEKLEN
jgi:hypothetical protein